MKIGGLTWWRNNYGSILQAYALQQELNSIPGVSYEIINQFGKKIISFDNLMDKLKTIGVRKTFLRIFWKFCFPKLKNRSAKIQKFTDEKLIVSDRQYSESTISDANIEYDVFVCGSDQIWNPTLTDIDSMYWLDFANENKVKFSYAPSIGVTKVSEKEKQAIQKHLSTFKAISCREETGTNLINQILGKQICQTVLDPTLMVDKKTWDEICPDNKYDFPYIFVYMLRGTKQQRKAVEIFAKERNLKIITMPFMESEYTVWYDLKFGDIKVWDAAPDEFIALIRNAKYVFTDSFHSSVFSILYHVPFFTFPKVGKAQMSRIIGLQDSLKIDSRTVMEKDDIIRVAKKKIDWEMVDALLEDRRKSSQYYIKNVIERCEVNLTRKKYN